MRHCLIASSIVLFILSVAHAGEPPQPSEDQKIESLLQSVESLKDAKFIRNGKAYDAKAAASHVRSKWKAAKDQIKSARDFITVVASKSSKTGEPYKIRFKDGKEQTSEAFLTAKLDELEGKKSDQQKT
jgi:hypothetical protein